MKLGLIFFIFLLSYQLSAQDLRIIVLPYTEEDLCQAFDEMTIKQRESIDEISSLLQKKGFKAASFNAIMRTLKGRGGCDTQNPQKMLTNVLKTAQSAYYATAEAGFQTISEGNYVDLNFSVYNAQTNELITYQSAQSDKSKSDDVRALTRNAFNKIIENVLAELKVGNTNQQNTNIVNNSKIKVNLISEVDNNLPKTNKLNPDAFAVVIGNANYEKTKTVNFALNDAAAMKKYLTETFGFKEGNIFYVEDARKSDFELYFGVKDNHRGKLFNAVKRDKSDVFVFYAGHGAPGLKDQGAYFVPVDCDPQYIELGGYATETFYRNLALIPAKSITVVLDACFSGANLFENISPIVIKAKGVLGLKNGVLLASSTDQQVSAWYNEKGHGLFSYFLFKAIHSWNADANKDKKLSFKEVFSYISDNSEGVPYLARTLHGVEQNPVLQGLKTDKLLVSER